MERFLGFLQPDRSFATCKLQVVTRIQISRCNPQEMGLSALHEHFSMIVKWAHGWSSLCSSNAAAPVTTALAIALVVCATLTQGSCAREAPPLAPSLQS